MGIGHSLIYDLDIIVNNNVTNFLSLLYNKIIVAYNRLPNLIFYRIYTIKLQ